jgi:hypothetical protein
MISLQATTPKEKTMTSQNKSTLNRAEGQATLHVLLQEQLRLAI